MRVASSERVISWYRLVSVFITVPFLPFSSHRLLLHAYCKVRDVAALATVAFAVGLLSGAPSPERSICIHIGEHGSFALAVGLGVERPGLGHIVNPGLDYIGIHLVNMAHTQHGSRLEAQFVVLDDVSLSTRFSDVTRSAVC